MPTERPIQKSGEEDSYGLMYLTRPQAAQYLNVPVHWLANNTKTGPPIIKIGGLVRYSVAALDAYMSAHERRQ